MSKAERAKMAAEAAAEPVESGES
ncbi:hypothetical protein V5O39_06780 [Pseudomonas parakoreensis]